MNFLIETLRLGLSNLMLHKLRSLLTVLGIIFGVGAVITMVAIGEGNKARALEEIQRLGARNIIVRSVRPPDRQDSGESIRRMLSYGLTRRDMRQIKATVSPIERIVPLKLVASTATQGRHKTQVAAFGTMPELLDLTSLRLQRGRYLTQGDVDRVDNVVVLGASVAERLFPLEDPINQTIRIERQVMRVVGVLKAVGLAGGAGTALVGRDLNFDIHMPITTAQARYGDVSVTRTAGSFEGRLVELTELYIETPTQGDVRPVSEQVSLLLERAHRDKDYTMVVPLELLEQAARTQRMFNTLMVAIASISLLVGGIGIMNIMLASVTERTREIGIRRSLGATRKHILAQFLIETTVLTCLGGFIGVALGVGMAWMLRSLPLKEIAPPQVPMWSVVVSFTVATSVGIIFGLYPAVMAARQDPIVALRHD